MQLQFLKFLFIADFLLIPLLCIAADQDIRLNSIGFLPNQAKQATITTACTDFMVVIVETDSVVYQGKVSEPFANEDTNETVYIVDFSPLQETGEYQLLIPEIGRSVLFRVGKDVYDFSFQTVMKCMYLWRCGTAVSGTHQGVTFSHEPCHMEDAYLDYVGQAGVKKDGLKGWHDAGDYNKYIVNAGVTVGAMFLAWEQFPQIHNVKLDLPESEANNDLPDFLDEMKWEMEWVLTMQAPDGSVYHKLSTPNFGPFILPEQEKEKRYFTPWSSGATADFVAMTAMASRIFEPYDKNFARQCLEAAVKSYEFLQANPDDTRANLKGFRTGAYQTNDPDDRLWAAAEMWQTTGDSKYLKDLEGRIKQEKRMVDTNWDWGNVKNLGIFTYLLSKREGKDPELLNKVQDALLANADSLVEISKKHGYGRPLGTLYYWGCNGTVARQCMNLLVANQLSPKPDYVNTAIAALDHLFGRNQYNRSFVTGLGLNPPQNPHDRRSGGDTIKEPWPGYLVGGGQKSMDWVDDQESYQTNEIAINWNGALIYALSAFTSE